MFLELDEKQDRPEKKLIPQENSVRSHVLWLPTKQTAINGILRRNPTT